MLDLGEPERVADAVEQMGLTFAVLTAVARDDLADGGASGFAATIDAIRRRTPATQVEVLIPDCKGDPDALRTAEEDKAPPKVLPRTRRPVDLEPPEPRFAAAGAC